MQHACTARLDSEFIPDNNNRATKLHGGGSPHTHTHQKPRIEYYARI